LDYRTLIGEILSGAIRRYKEREVRKAAENSAPPKPEDKHAAGGNGHANGNGLALGHGELGLEVKA
jgi:D-alanine-D-alanine ligase